MVVHHLTTAILALLYSQFVNGQVVKSFYSTPDAQYSTEYSLTGPAYRGRTPVADYSRGAVRPEPVLPSAHTYAGNGGSAVTGGVEGGYRRQRFDATPRAVPAELNFPAFPAPASRARLHSQSPTPVAAAAFRPRPVTRPVYRSLGLSGLAGGTAVAAYPVSADVRVAGRDYASPALVASAGRARPLPTTSSVSAPPAAVFERVSYPPTPYAFDYSVSAADGRHSRSERGDGAGRVTGSYSIQLADGRSRIVEYVADEAGYRASVRTNEFGTESQSPADVTLQSSAIPAREATLLAERDQAFRLYGPARHTYSPAGSASSASSSAAAAAAASSSAKSSS